MIVRGLPEVLYPAFRVAFDVFHETQFDGGEHDRERFERRMLERILTQYEGLAADDIDYMLDRLGKPDRRRGRGRRLRLSFRSTSSLRLVSTCVLAQRGRRECLCD